MRESLVRSLFRRRRADASAVLPAGPRGRILFLTPFNGGIGGAERLTKSFADWIDGSGFTALLLAQTDYGPGPYHVRDQVDLRVLPTSAWGESLATVAFDFAYVITPALDRRAWVPRLEALDAMRIVLNLDAKGKFASVTDAVHAEVPPDEPLAYPTIVATPDASTTRPPPGAAAPVATPGGDHYLTAFNPYGALKGLRHLAAFCRTSDRPLVWCYDPTTFGAMRKKVARSIRRNVAETRSIQGLQHVPTPSREQLYDLYARCAGYVCFSDSEGLGWSMVDALDLGKPLAARRVGIAKAIPNFVPTEDFAAPVFGTYDPPPAPGFEGVFAQAAVLREKGSP